MNRASEFAGRPYADQRADIQQGKQILEGYGFHVSTFIAPWHSYDRETLRALADCGFRALSDGWSLYPKMTAGLVQLPVILWSAPSRLKALSRLDGIYTICLHPHLVRDEDLDTLERFFREARPLVTTAAAVAATAAEVTRRNLKKWALDALFSLMYRRPGAA